MPKTVAETIVETLHAAGVRRVYGVAGDSLNGFTDALRRRPRSDGCTCATRRRRRSPPAPRRT